MTTMATKKEKNDQLVTPENGIQNTQQSLGKICINTPKNGNKSCTTGVE